MSATDRILLEARENSLQLEQLAVADLARNMDSYLPPSFRVRKLVEGYGDYVAKGQTDHDVYYSMRKAFTETRGKSNQTFGDVLSTYIKPRNYEVQKSMFGPNKDWDAHIRGAVLQLNRDGYWISRFTAPDSLVEKLKVKALAGLEKMYGGDVEKAMTAAPDAPVQMKSSALWLTAVDEMYQFASDPVILSIVQQYLGVPPIFNTPLIFLNSTATVKGDKGLSDVAQLYHHDMHRLRFIKIFLYLTDVDEGSGPHAMIPGTHRSRPDPHWEDGRHTDEALTRAGLLQKEVRITGKKGTIFLVDTSALHKGVHPDTTPRLIAQVQYVNSLFGKPLARGQVDRKILHAGKSDDADMNASADMVRRYAGRFGVRFMQNLI